MTAETEAARSDTVEVEWRGETLTLPASLDDAPIEVLEMFESGKAVGAIRALLGEQQYERLKIKLDLRGRDLKELSDLVANEMGFGDSGK